MNRCLFASTAFVLILAACSGESPEAPAPVADKPDAAPLPASVCKLTAPVDIDYSIMGNPIVGQPVGVNVRVSTPLDDRPIILNYRVSEVGSMTFPESQAASSELLPLATSELRSQQVTVIPQREGRLFLVVSAEVETDTGTVMKSMSIPIQVGRAPVLPAGAEDLVESADGELGVSMPATEPPRR